jgi:hypothetical protein
VPILPDADCLGDHAERQVYAVRSLEHVAVACGNRRTFRDLCRETPGTEDDTRGFLRPL